MMDQLRPLLVKSAKLAPRDPSELRRKKREKATEMERQNKTETRKMQRTKRTRTRTRAKLSPNLIRMHALPIRAPLVCLESASNQAKVAGSRKLFGKTL